ncbi:MAG: PIN domain-containing protein [Clostridia bacterium]|nr:PIN domain-containing protein [Clostridia bacterium]MBC7346405.1 PIN domain-containing protein [Clostridia bacterium]
MAPPPPSTTKCYRKSRSHRNVMAGVNLGEAAYIVSRKAGVGKRDLFLLAVEALPLRVVSADKELALIAAEFKADLPMAFADCFVLALARLVGGAVVLKPITNCPQRRYLALAWAWDPG